MGFINRSMSFTPGGGNSAEPSASTRLAGEHATLQRGAAGAFVVMIVGAGLGLLSQVVIARILRVDQYGTYALMLGWTSLLATVSQIGLDTVVTRFLPVYAHREDWGSARGLHRGSQALVATISALVATIAFFWLTRRDSPVGDERWLGFLFGFAALPWITAIQQDAAWHRAFKHVAASGAYLGIVRPSLLLLLIGVYWWGAGYRLDLQDACQMYLLSAVLAFIASRIHSARYWPECSRGMASQYDWRVWAKVGAPLALLSFLILACNRIGVLMVGELLGDKSAGPYYVALQIVTLASFGINAVNSILAPMISGLYVANDLATLQKVLRRAAWINLGITAVIVLAIVLAGPWVLTWFGKGFGAARQPMLILLAGESVNAIAGPVGFLMTMTQHERIAVRVFVVGAVVNIGLGLLLIPRFGAVGAAWAGFAGTAIWNFLALLFALVRMRLNPTIFGRLA